MKNILKIIKTKFNYKFSYILFFIFLLCCCKNKHEDISPDTTMIQIDNVHLPKAKTDKVIPGFIVGYKEYYNEKPSVDSLKNIMHQYCNELYFAADAFKKGYDTINEVQEAYGWIMQFLTTDIYRKFQDDHLSETKLTDEEMDIAFKRRKFIYHVDIMKFRYIEEAEELLHIDLKSNAVSKQNFEQLYKVLEQNNPFNISTEAIRWPFHKFSGINVEIFKMKKGEVKGPIIIPSNIFFIRLNSIEEIYQSNEENEYAMLRNELLKVRNENYQLNSIGKIMEQAKIIFNEKNSKEYLESIVQTQNGQNENDKIYTLAKFQWKDQHYPINSDQLNSFYSYSKNQMPLTTIYDLREYIKIYVFHFYNYQNALKMNVDKKIAYKIQEDVTLYNILIKYYSEREIMNYISVSEEEIQKFYNENTQLFREAEVVYLTEIVFESKLNAIHNLKKIQQAAISNNLKKLQYKDYLPGLTKIEFQQPVKYNSDRFTPVELNDLFSMQNWQCTDLMEKEGRYVYFIKEGESGQRIQDLQEIKIEIGKQLWHEKFTSKKDSILLGLKNIYQIEDYIDYDYFLK